ncbi:hypothetical protein GGI43DRAFT_146088 [Trichoderma evansii]
MTTSLFLFPTVFLRTDLMPWRGGAHRSFGLCATTPTTRPSGTKLTGSECQAQRAAREARLTCATAALEGMPQCAHWCLAIG